MKNKDLQEQRMRGYFIQATREILKREGIKAVSVRNIAEQAGYSFATLYNYFRDINELVFHSVSDFHEECKAFVAEHTIKEPRGLKKLKASILAYIRYFTEYPGIFELFYLTNGGDFGNRQQTLDVISHSLDKVCEAEWDFCVGYGRFSETEASQKRAQLRYAVIGMLTLYLNRLTPKTYTEFIREANQLIDSVLGQEE
ncbi:MAG: TetR/AcrR family transcriptional regulator [Bacteroidales bacterium]|nr:TetR/AcrR family transcriptional regulator [Bacteroidales bacterium]